MRLLGLTFSIVLFALPAFAQNPDGVNFVLATKDGKTTFRIGEEIDLEFRFSAQAVNRYAKEQSCYPTRRTTFISEDEFAVEPRVGTVDPLVNSLALYWPGPGSCIHGATQFLSTTPWIQDRILNEWVEFRQPGRYRITANSGHQVSGVQGPPLVLQSNAVEIEIVAPEPGWAEKQVQEAIAALKSSRNEDEILRAGRTLRFLESAEAVPALVEYFDRSHAGDELRLGMISSPFKTEILAGLDAQLVAPDFPVTENWFRTYSDLETVATKGPPPKPPVGALSRENSGDNLQAGRLWTAELNAYYGPGIESRRPSLTAVSNALPQKQGQARVVTLKTLLVFGGRPPDESVRRAVIASFTELPDSDQYRLLSEWELWAGPDAHAAILAAARSSNGRARDAALIRLMEFSVDEARQVVIDRVRRGDGIFSRELLMLPDKTIPELDNVLATAYEQRQAVDRLIARYATDQVLDRVRTAFEKRPPVCGEILAYFYRVNPDVAQTYRNAVIPKCSLTFDWPVRKSPGLEQAAIQDLARSNPMLLLPALKLLERGSQKAADALWKALEQSNQDPFVTTQIVYTLRKPGDWFFTPAEFDRMKAVCPPDTCGQDIKCFAQSLTSPVPVEFNMSSIPVGLERIHIGPFEASDREESLKIIQRFPAGTHFRLVLPLGIAPWFYQRRLDEVTAAFATSGIEIDKSP